MSDFKFLSPGDLFDDVLELKLAAIERAADSIWDAPTYRFHIHHKQLGERIGHINLRVGDSELLRLYVGHIGYGIDLAHRGHHFAERACRVLIPFAGLHGMETIWITCGPDNVASQRTLNRLGATFVETLDVPPSYPLPEGAIRQKCRYKVGMKR